MFELLNLGQCSVLKGAFVVVSIEIVCVVVFRKQVLSNAGKRVRCSDAERSVSRVFAESV